MSLAMLALAWGLFFSFLLLFLALLAVCKGWKATVEFRTDRIERACDSVTLFVSFLIPAALTLTTWVYEKTHTPWYGFSLAAGAVWFLIVLLFTMYMRFNFVWRLGRTVKIDNTTNKANLRIPYWLSTVMVGLTVGLAFLAVPIFSIAFRTSPEASKPSVTVHCDCPVNPSTTSQSGPPPKPSSDRSNKGN